MCLFKNAPNEKTQGVGMQDFGVLLVWGFSGGISTGLSVGMGLKSNPNGSPDKSGSLFHAVDV